MIGNIITGIVTYVSTSIDDLLVSAIFFAQSNSKRDNIRIITGKYLGTGLLVAIGCLGCVWIKIYSNAIYRLDRLHSYRPGHQRVSKYKKD